MTSKLVVNTIEADTGISSVSFASSISMNSTAKFHFSAAGVDIGADTNINRPAAGVLGFNISGAEKLRIDTNGHLNTSGIVTAANFKSGVTNVHNLGVTLTGGQLDVGSNIKIGTAGVVTATSFVGSGANLTGITQTTINSNSDNRVITGSGTANTLNAESTFVHDPVNCDTQIIHNSNNVADLLVQNNSGGTGANARLTLQSGSNSNAGPQLGMVCGSHNWYLQVPKAAGNLEFTNNGTLDFLMADDGDFHIVDGDLVFSTAGHGIDFSATSDASGGTSELLDDYEEGSWTPTIYRSNNSGVSGNYNHQEGSYVRIGRLVFVAFRADIASFSGGSGHTVMGGLPFSTNLHGVGGWNYVANMRRMYLDGDYARGVDANSLVAAGGISYMYNMNLDDDQWNYTNYGRVIFEGTFTYQTS